jgi:hypothetical protein
MPAWWLGPRRSLGTRKQGTGYSDVGVRPNLPALPKKMKVNRRGASPEKKTQSVENDKFPGAHTRSARAGT